MKKNILNDNLQNTEVLEEKDHQEFLNSSVLENSKTKKEQENEKKLDVLLYEIEKKHGKGSFFQFSKQNEKNKVKVIPTGSINLDKAIGVNGYPRGRIIEVYGPESSGKTTLALHAIAQSQKLKGKVAFIDVEHALDPIYSSKLGVNMDKLYFCQPNSGEEALDILERLLKSKLFDLVVVDSVAALVPQIELNGDITDHTIGAQARLMSKTLRKINGILHKSNTTVIFINQLREKINNFFGNPETTPGGKALRFYSSLRLDIRRVERINDEKGNLKGFVAKVKVIKNKLAAPFQIARISILFETGICNYSEVIEFGLKEKIFVKNGSWYSYENKNIVQGKNKLIIYLKENPKIFKKIKKKLLVN